MTAEYKPLSDQERKEAMALVADGAGFVELHRTNALANAARTLLPRYEATVREAQERALFMEQQYRAIQDYLIRIATGRTLNAVETPIPIDPVIKDLSATVVRWQEETRAAKQLANLSKALFDDSEKEVKELEATIVAKDAVIAGQAVRIEEAIASDTKARAAIAEQAGKIERTERWLSNRDLDVAELRVKLAEAQEWLRLIAADGRYPLIIENGKVIAPRR